MYICVILWKLIRYKKFWISWVYEYVFNVLVVVLVIKLFFECDSFFNLVIRDYEEMKFFWRNFIMGGFVSGFLCRVCFDFVK